MGGVQALIDAGRFEEAIVALRPLLGRESVDANVLFLYGAASLGAAHRPGRAAIAPDSNLNTASESEIIYIDTAFGRLPFTRQGDFGAESGFGLSVWGGGA